jgi:hypothetical protein
MIKQYKIQLDHIKDDIYHYNIYYYLNGEFEGRYFYAMDLNNPEGYIEQGYTKHIDSL